MILLALFLTDFYELFLTPTSLVAVRQLFFFLPGSSFLVLSNNAARDQVLHVVFFFTTVGRGGEAGERSSGTDSEDGCGEVMSLEDGDDVVKMSIHYPGIDPLKEIRGLTETFEGALMVEDVGIIDQINARRSNLEGNVEFRYLDHLTFLP